MPESLKVFCCFADADSDTALRLAYLSASEHSLAARVNVSDAGVSP